MRNQLLFSLAFLFSTQGQSQLLYYGQDPPTSLAPKIFAPFLISTQYNERDFTIHPDGSEIFFTIEYAFNRSNIFCTKLKDGHWSLVQKAPFSDGPGDLEPAFSPDGSKLFFSSNRGLDGTIKDFDIWYVVRQQDGSWSQPQLVPGSINSAGHEFYPSVARDGSLYFTSSRIGGIGGEDIWVSRFVSGVYQFPDVLPLAINSTGGEYNAFIDPDERYIYFSSDGRADEIGRGDLYFSEKTENGEWSSAVRLNFNSEDLDYCPYVSPDGQYLFFTSEKSFMEEELQNPFDLNQVFRQILSPDNGKGNIYWKKR